MPTASRHPRPSEALAALAALPLVVEEAAAELLQRRVADGSTRRTALLRLRSVGEEGLGEDVTFQQTDLMQEPPPLLQRAPSTLGGLWEALDGADLFARPPRHDVVRSYRRWAIEAAALDLALRQNGLDLCGVLGHRPAPLTFVVSAPGNWAATAPAVRLKVDAAALAPGLPVEIVDFKGEGDEELVQRALELYPHALQEDPPVVVTGARVSWDVPIRSARDLDLLPAVPAAINVKPARFGSLRGLLELYERCAERGIAMYGGGQFELGPGRGQAQLLASLFHPGAPNDLAPAAYNEAEPPATLPPSPIAVVHERGFRAAT